MTSAGLRANCACLRVGTPVFLQRYLDRRGRPPRRPERLRRRAGDVRLQPEPRRLMQHVIQTKQLITLRKPIDAADEVTLEKAAAKRRADSWRPRPTASTRSTARAGSPRTGNCCLQEYTERHHDRREISPSRSHPPGRAARPARQVHRRGVPDRPARQPVPRLLRRVLRAPQVHPGDDLKTLDWNVYAKTGKYFVKKFRAETNMTGYLVMDLSKSMDWNGPAEARKAKVKLDCSTLGGRGRDAHQVRLRHLPGRRARLPDDPPAGPGRPGRVRHQAHHGHPAQEQADATRHHPLGAGEPEADRARRTSPTACSSSRP